jgi:hypothetical protein
LGQDAIDAAKETGDDLVKIIEPYYKIHKRKSESSGSKVNNPLSLSVTKSTGLGRRSRKKQWIADDGTLSAALAVCVCIKKEREREIRVSG